MLEKADCRWLVTVMTMSIETALTAFQIGFRIDTFPSILSVEAVDTTCSLTSGTKRALFFGVQLPLLWLSGRANFEWAADSVTDFVRECTDALNGQERRCRERDETVLAAKVA